MHQNVLDNQGFWCFSEPKEARQVMFLCKYDRLQSWLLTHMGGWLILDSNKCLNDQKILKQWLAPAAKDVAAALLRASTGPSKSLVAFSWRAAPLPRLPKSPSQKLGVNKIQWDSWKIIIDYQIGSTCVWSHLGSNSHSDFIQNWRKGHWMSLISWGEAPFQKSEAVSYHSHCVDIETLRPERSVLLLLVTSNGIQVKIGYSNWDNKLHQISKSDWQLLFRGPWLLILTHTPIWKVCPNTCRVTKWGVLQSSCLSFGFRLLASVQGQQPHWHQVSRSNRNHLAWIDKNCVSENNVTSTSSPHNSCKGSYSNWPGRRKWPFWKTACHAFSNTCVSLQIHANSLSVLAKE